jgi:hypothetical protein
MDQWHRFVHKCMSTYMWFHHIVIIRIGEYIANTLRVLQVFSTRKMLCNMYLERLELEKLYLYFSHQPDGNLISKKHITHYFYASRNRNLTL